MYGEGVSKVGEIIDLAVEFEFVKKSGSWFSYGDTKIGQGRDSVLSLLKDNPELADELEKRVRDRVSADDKALLDGPGDQDGVIEKDEE